MQTNVEICFIQEYPSLFEGLSDLTGCSKNKIKKYSQKKELERPVQKRQVVSISLNLINDGKIYPYYSGSKINIIAEDKLFTVVSKPVQVHCHPLTYCESDNLLSALINRKINAPVNTNLNKYDRGCLYRLDFETSGLMILANNDDVYSEIRDHFYKAAKSKVYLAVVEGEIDKIRNLSHNLSSSGVGKRKMVVSSSSAVLAECIVTPLEYNQNKNMTLVKVQLNQGHRHQIRVQLSHIGHPIVGDELYGERGEYKRLFLHCWKYTLVYKDKEYSYEDKNLDFLADFFNFNR